MKYRLLKYVTMAEHKFKLTYFNSRGGAELSRLVFNAAGVEFEDERVQRESWLKIKPDMPMQALPVLEIDGEKFCQSNAIARYLAKEFGLMGSSYIDALRIEEIMEAMTELVNREIVKIYYEQDEEKKKQLMTTFVNEGMKKYLDFFQKRLKENHGETQFLLGEKLSLGDLVIYDGITLINSFVKKMGTDPLKDHPLLDAHFKRVGAVPRIAEWVEKRPTTDF